MEFNGVNHFVECMRLLNLTPDLINIQNIINGFNGLSGGCSCNRNARAAAVSNSYNNLVNILTDLEKLFLKASYNNQIIVFKDGQNILGQF